MGLDYGVAALLKDEVPLFFSGEPQYMQQVPGESTNTEVPASPFHQDEDQTPSLLPCPIQHLEHNGKVCILWDVMTQMTSLAAFGRPDTIEKQIFNVWRARKAAFVPKEYSAYTANALYETIANDTLDILGDLPTRFEVTLVIVFDKGDVVVHAKKAVQQVRSSHQDLPPYPVPGLSELESMTHTGNASGLPRGVCVVDAGLDLGDGMGPRKIISERLMQTRVLRSIWFAYIARRFQRDPRFVNVRLYVDYRSDTVFEAHRGQVIERRNLAVPVGEGEVAVMTWGLRFAHSHRVQIRSGDSDLIALGLLHYDRFAHPLMAVLHRRRTSLLKTRQEIFLTLNAQEFAGRLKARQWPVAAFYLGLVMNGTDFVIRTTFLRGVRKSAVMHACRAFVLDHLEKNKVLTVSDHSDLRTWVLDTLHHRQTFDVLVRTIMSWHYMHSSATVWKGPRVPHDGSMIQVLSTATLVERRQKAVAHPSSAAIDGAHVHVLTNLSYWDSLQDTLECSREVGYDCMEIDLQLVPTTPQHSSPTQWSGGVGSVPKEFSTFSRGAALTLCGGFVCAFSAAQSAYVNAYTTRTAVGTVPPVIDSNRPATKKTTTHFLPTTSVHRTLSCAPVQQRGASARRKPYAKASWTGGGQKNTRSMPPGGPSSQNSMASVSQQDTKKLARLKKSF